MPAPRPWKALLAALLLLIPLALQSHVHAGAHASSDCAVCVISHHTPTVRAATPAVVAPIVVPSTVGAATSVAPASVDRPAHAGRGPPALLSSTTA